MTIRKLRFLLIIAALITGGRQMSLSQQGVDSAYEAFTRDQQKQFDQFSAQEDSLYNQFYQEQERQYEDYKNNIAREWGDKNVTTSTKKDWVSYDDDFKARRSVDFEHGTAKVEIIVPKATRTNDPVVQKKLRDEVVKMVSDKGGNDPLAKKEGVAAESKPILSEQLRTKTGKTVTESNAGQFAQEILKSGKSSEVHVDSKEGENVAIVIEIPLIPDHIQKRARAYKDAILYQSQRFKISPALLFAVTHTESFFNPKARSPVPAYGLMQLVPKSGARAAYLYINKVDSLLKPEYLYVPYNNLELGAGYLDLLMKRDFKNIKNDTSRLYCAICAYNTGPGNVARAFTGKRNVNDAVPLINKMSANKVYRTLKAKLPYEETRQYIELVAGRLPMYEGWGEKE